MGSDGYDYVWDDLNLQASISSPRIYGNLTVMGPAPNLTYGYNLFYGEFMRPLEIIGDTFTITMTFSHNKVTYEVDDLGEIEYKLPEDFDPLTEGDDVYYFKGIGTRSTNGDGPCVVYFDDVYILK
jgi:hypothetical protein